MRHATCRVVQTGCAPAWYGEQWRPQASVAGGGGERVAYSAMPTTKDAAAVFIRPAANSTRRNVLNATYGALDGRRRAVALESAA